MIWSSWSYWYLITMGRGMICLVGLQPVIRSGSREWYFSSDSSGSSVGEVYRNFDGIIIFDSIIILFEFSKVISNKFCNNLRYFLHIKMLN